MNSIELVRGVLNTMRVEGSLLTTKAEFDMMEQAVREQIAQDIINEYDGDDQQYWLTDILKRCVEIARGEVGE